MPEYNIKISELNPFTSSARTEDFFPLVDSSSMTTFRATIQDIGLLITQSLSASYVPASAVEGSVQFATSASWASASISASYALSASHARLADSASYYPPQQFQVSCSWASRSLQSWYATRSIDVDTNGAQFNFPYWNTWYAPGTNGALNQKSPLVYYPYSAETGLVVEDSASTKLTSYQVYPNHRPDINIYRYGERANVAWGFAPNIGFQTVWPITSQTFVGTDQRDWYFSTASSPHPPFDPDLMVTNSYFSGSAGDSSSGSFYKIPDAPGAMASIFNGKWVRFASALSNPIFYDDTVLPGTNPPLPDHPPQGVMWSSQDQIMKGLISLQLNTTVFTGGSNAWNQIDFWFHQNQWGSGISCQILHVNTYGPQLIRAIRFHSTNGIKDPPMFIDVLIDGLYAGGETPGGLGEPVMTIKAQSWQGVRFLKWLNVDPWPLQDTGSNDISQDGTTLIVPAAPGFYSNVSKNMNYYVQGKNVVIWPNPNQITQSGAAVQSMASTQSLFVSGGINTNTAFYCDNNKGLTTKVTYGTTNLYFSGGILINKFPPDGAPPAGTACNGQGTVQGGNQMPNEQTWVLGDGTGVVTVYFYTYTVPDRLQVFFDGNVILNTGYRGNASYQSQLNTALASYGSASEYIQGGSKFSGSFFKNSSTTTAKVQVFGPIGSTAWNYWISCPGQPIT